MVSIMTTQTSIPTTQYPRVTGLTYQIETKEPHVYMADAESTGQVQGFAYRFKRYSAQFDTLKWYPSQEAARAELEPQLRAWAVHSALTHGAGVLSFKFLQAQVEEGPPVPGVARISGVACLFIGGRVGVEISYRHHPQPPAQFAVDEFVQTLADLFNLARGTPLTLLYIAYSMSTCIEDQYGGRINAGATLSIAPALLKRINRLANERGVGAEVRKFDPNVIRKPLSDAERDWLNSTLKLIVLRAGAVAAGATGLAEISLQSNPAP